VSETIKPAKLPPALCVCCGWWRGPWCGLAVFSASRAALDTQGWFPWTPAGAGTCLFSGTLCGNASSDRHVPFTSEVPDSALWDFKNRKNLPQICGCYKQMTMMASSVALQAKSTYLPHKLFLNKGPPGKYNFRPWRILSMGSESLCYQGIRSAIIQAPPAVCMGIWVY